MGTGIARMGELELGVVREGFIQTGISERTKVSEPRVQPALQVSGVTLTLDSDMTP